MSHMQEWKALSSRIHGLMRAGELHARFLSNNSSDPYNCARRLREQCEGVLVSLERFCDVNRSRMPSDALKSIQDFITNHKTLITNTTGKAYSLQHQIATALVLFGGLESEISFAFSDSQEAIRSRSERGFSHLQRSIVADPDIKTKWTRAFADGEVACERLGGVHLLGHGIFAFKVNADGERTDLVFQDILASLSDQERYVDGLVLTEWKKATDDKNAERQFRAAKEQASRYAAGSLGGVELTSYRYLIVVTDRIVQPPPDATEGNVTFRHINIAVDPLPPSKKSAPRVKS